MDDPLVVRGLERGRDLPRDRQRLVEWNRPSRDPLVEVLAVDEFEHEELRAVGFIETVDRTNVRVIEGGEDVCFATEAGDTLGIAREARGQDLQRDVTSELDIFRAIHLPHAACTEGRDDFIDTEPSAGTKGHQKV